MIYKGEPVLPRKTRVARSGHLADIELFAQVINRRREQLDGIVNQSGLQLCGTNNDNRMNECTIDVTLQRFEPRKRFKVGT